MSIDFENILEHVIPMENFSLSWRFTDEKYDKLPLQHLEQLKPLYKQASLFLANYIVNSTLHERMPFKPGFFKTIDKTRIEEENQKEIKKWLYQRAIPFDKQVFLSWGKDCALISPWKLVIKYFDSFYYSGSDDLTIIDQSLAWAVLFHHADEIYFGTNKEFKPSDIYENNDFIW